jgi:uracil-DNA glycosylase family 4
MSKMDRVFKAIGKLNQQIKHCQRCPLSQTRTHSLCGEGSLHARILIVAQAPGENEDRQGVMFIGPSGQVLDELFAHAQINRNDLYMTNLIKCMLPKYRRPKPEEIDACSQYLEKEIDLINPSVVATLGYYATRYMFDRLDIQMPPKAEYHTILGKLFWNGNRKLFPLRHPAALLYDENRRGEMLEHYDRLKTLNADCKWYPLCPLKQHHDAGKLDSKWIELFCKGDWQSCVRFQMEENGQPHSDWLLPDGTMAPQTN